MSDLLDLIVDNDEKLQQIKREQAKKVPKKEKQKKIESKAEEEDQLDLKEPSAFELQESEILLKTLRNKETNRSKKRKFHETFVESKKIKTKSSVEEYLNQWSTNREEFKFKKSRQIYIQKFVLDDSKISENIWPITLSYCEGMQGKGKEVIVEKAKKVIDELDSKDSRTEQESIRYRRARELLQNLS